ncbi:hypothetical protein RM553_01920 [Zunongwangia sp. F363]|uniref:Lipoprotein n=1 Tax=Autumnicola tepida TaxID=3075595 RepID=A0ABU3C5L9_9FLAO|nr:hypothetical protein [Zunongwangia sp. F363]MDT0641578.1 hypothetical protein [Zunongwangia sp. F363]
MKKFFLLSGFLLIIFSCSKEAIINLGSSNNPEGSTAEDLKAGNQISIDTLNKVKVLTLAELDSLIALDFKDYKKINKGEELNLLFSKGGNFNSIIAKSSIEWEGPFSVYSQQTKIQDDVLLAISGAPLLATGYYYCDVYLNKAEVELSINSVGRAEPKILYVNGSPKEWTGYTDLQNFEKGLNYYTNASSTSQTLIITTYSIRVINSLEGKYINRYLPEQIGQNLPFNYFYLEY